MSQLNDLSRSLVILEQDATLIAVIEMGQSSWLVAGIVPGVERSPLKKLAVDESVAETSIAGGRKRRKQDIGSNGLLSPSRPVVTASGWRAGSGLEVVVRL
jgi:hypothetical protein